MGFSRQYTSTGTSCRDLPANTNSNFNQFGPVSQHLLPADLFGNCPEIRNFLDNRNLRSTSPSRFEEITNDDEEEDICVKKNFVDEEDEKFNLTFSKNFNRQPNSVNDWKKMEKFLEAETDKNCRKIEEFVEGFNVDDTDDEEDEDVRRKTVKDVWSLRSFQSPEESPNMQDHKGDYKGGIFCRKPEETQQIPAFLKIHQNLSNSGEESPAEMSDSEKKEVRWLIEEVDLD